MAPLFPLLLIFLLPSCYSLPLCTDSRYPVALNAPLTFCGFANGSSSCCNTTNDDAIASQFKSMNISDSACASVVKSILCAKCNPYSGDLFNVQPNVRTVPFLCNSTVSSNNFCTTVWNSCKDVTIKDSPFSQITPGSSSKLTDTYKTEGDFCAANSGSSGGQLVCFDGSSASFNSAQTSLPPNGLCLERIDNGTYINMVPHPDRSNRVFVSNQAGKIWLAAVPDPASSGGKLQYDEADPFLDLSDVVHFDNEFGLLGLAFHPSFPTNGRFFVSYSCDSSQSPSSCSGRCSCNSDSNCDPSKLGTDNGAQPCQFFSVIAEYSANSSSSTPSEAKTARPIEVRRIFTVGLPYTTHHGGQILFGPADGYLYFMMGDGGNDGDPFNFAQNKRSVLGKILRLDVDNMPSSNSVNNVTLWGNYSIPKDNPSTEDSGLLPEIWAFGFKNPWRCSFDSGRPSYFFCGDVGQESYEEIDLVTKGGNYGWRVYEGFNLYTPPWSPGGNTSVSSINPIFPVMGYYHTNISKVGSASVTGGFVYRSMTDPCLYGRYIYADLYGTIWTGLETPEASGNYTSTLIPYSCSKNSPIACDIVAGSTSPSLGYIFSFAEDNQKDIYLLTGKGVYRVVPPSLCNYTCSKEIIPVSPPGPPSSGSKLESFLGEVLISMLAYFVFLLSFCF
ncbi:HIPL1 protein-like [Ananas comosus]|uniref:HIPL1 protein-like n=1 Tax=Ananas comosus TaxID=4615 RepID=A0A6P5FKC4_ANACO|nr:HIPL1 protein-like [Ananas comosus]